MFTDTTVFSAFAVDDLAQARKLYSETLGVRVSDVKAAVGALTKRASSSSGTTGWTRTSAALPAAAAHSSPPGSRTRPETSSRCCRSAGAGSACVPALSRPRAESWRNSAVMALEHQLASPIIHSEKEN